MELEDEVRVGVGASPAEQPRKLSRLRKGGPPAKPAAPRENAQPNRAPVHRRDEFEGGGEAPQPEPSLDLGGHQAVAASAGDAEPSALGKVGSTAAVAAGGGLGDWHGHPVPTLPPFPTTISGGDLL